MTEEKTYKSGEVMSMLEQMNDGIKLIGEQHGELVGEIKTINKRLDGIDGRLDGIDGRLDGIDGRLDGIDGRLDGMQSDITEIKHKLSEKVDRQEFNNLEKRVIKMEKFFLAKTS